MTCEKCKAKRATVFFTESDRTRHSMCAGCAQQYKNREIEPSDKALQDEIFTPVLNFTELELSDPGAFFINSGGDSKRKCEVCGASENELRDRGEMGCPACYESFAEILPGKYTQELIARSIRMPGVEKKRIERIRMAEELRGKLKEAVAGEDFESAAKLRDKIKALEKDA